MDILSLLVALAAPPATPTIPPAEISFQDGSIVKMSVKEKSLDMQTKYGKLALPLIDIRRIEFGKTDTIHTADGPIVGSLLNATILAHSPYFGDVTLKRTDLRAIQLRINSGIEIEKVIDVNDPWIDTGLIVAKGDRFLVMAIGSIDLWPQNPGMYIATAKGYTVNGKNSSYPGCALQGKIGDKIFLLSDRWEGTMPADGTLELSIVPPPWENSTAQGNYRVTIKGKPL